MIPSAVTSDLAVRAIEESRLDPDISVRQAIKQATTKLLKELEGRPTDRQNFETWFTSPDRIWFHQLHKRRNTSIEATARFLANCHLAEEIASELPTAAKRLGIEPAVA